MSKKHRQKQVQASSKPKPPLTVESLAGRQIRIQILLLILILLMAGILRIIHLGTSPIGLNVDEVVNAWNANCLLKTGMDQHGIRWPIFDSAGFGQGMTTLYLYLLIPFEAIFGLSVLAIRLPAALAGVLTVYLLYWVGRKLFNPWVGLLAAAFLAVSPWHLQQSRWGHMAAIFPLLVMAPLAAMIWANLPFDDRENPTPRVFRAALAGVIFGICCYGYYAARLWLPVFFLATAAVNWRSWQRILRTRTGAVAAGTLILFVGITFGPLVWETLVNPPTDSRASVSWVWNPADSLGQRVEKVLARYPGHFGTDFLFSRGDSDPTLSPPIGYGLFHWYMLPLMLVGLVAIIPKWTSSGASRVLITWILLYPAADLLSEHNGPHALRGLPGVCALTLLAAIGAIYALKWFWNRHRKATILFAMIAAVVLLATSFRFLRYFYGNFNSEQVKYLVGHTDILKACDWLKPKLDRVDTVFVTSYLMSHPYIYTLVGLQYDPHRWFLDPREMKMGPLPGGAYNHEQICMRYGKLNFIFGDSIQSAMDELSKNSRSDRVVFIVRPGELQIDRRLEPSYRILDPQGRAVLLIFDINM
jgi:4-amino-4-deoxy-L-arabinose transferase-like glycosyltransferase